MPLAGRISSRITVALNDAAFRSKAKHTDVFGGRAALRRAPASIEQRGVVCGSECLRCRRIAAPVADPFIPSLV
jgi:hypothetical protein